MGVLHVHGLFGLAALIRAPPVHEDPVDTVAPGLAAHEGGRARGGGEVVQVGLGDRPPPQGQTDGLAIGIGQGAGVVGGEKIVGIVSTGAVRRVQPQPLGLHGVVAVIGRHPADGANVQGRRDARIAVIGHEGAALGAVVVDGHAQGTFDGARCATHGHQQVVGGGSGDAEPDTLRPVADILHFLRRGGKGREVLLAREIVAVRRALRITGGANQRVKLRAVMHAQANVERERCGGVMVCANDRFALRHDSRSLS